MREAKSLHVYKGFNIRLGYGWTIINGRYVCLFQHDEYAKRCKWYIEGPMIENGHGGMCPGYIHPDGTVHPSMTPEDGGHLSGYCSELKIAAKAIRLYLNQ